MALLEIYFIRVGNVLQKSINQQILMVVCLWVFRQSVLLLLWMQCIIFLYRNLKNDWSFCRTPYHTTGSPLCFWRKQELDTDFATVTWPSSLWFNKLISPILRLQISKNGKISFFLQWILKNSKAGYRAILWSQWWTDILQIFNGCCANTLSLLMWSCFKIQRPTKTIWNQDLSF